MTGMNVGERVARTIVWEHLYGGQKVRVKNNYMPFTHEEAAVISAKGTIADMCGSLYDSMNKATGNNRRNLRLLYNLPEALHLYNKACEESSIEMYHNATINDTEILGWIVDALNGLVTRECEPLQFTEEQVAKTADEIYIDILPVTVEMFACKILDLQDGKIKKVLYDEYLCFHDEDELETAH